MMWDDVKNEGGVEVMRRVCLCRVVEVGRGGRVGWERLMNVKKVL